MYDYADEERWKREHFLKLLRRAPQRRWLKRLETSDKDYELNKIGIKLHCFNWTMENFEGYLYSVIEADLENIIAESSFWQDVRARGGSDEQITNQL